MYQSKRYCIIVHLCNTSYKVIEHHISKVGCRFGLSEILTLFFFFFFFFGGREGKCVMHHNAGGAVCSLLISSPTDQVTSSRAPYRSWLSPCKHPYDSSNSQANRVLSPVSHRTANTVPLTLTAMPSIDPLRLPPIPHRCSLVDLSSPGVFTSVCLLFRARPCRCQNSFSL